MPGGPAEAKANVRHREEEFGWLRARECLCRGVLIGWIIRLDQ